MGDIVATTLYACIGDVTRFPNAKSLAAYVGLVPSVRQSADTNVRGQAHSEHLRADPQITRHTTVRTATPVRASTCRPRDRVRRARSWGKGLG